MAHKPPSISSNADDADLREFDEELKQLPKLMKRMKFGSLLKTKKKETCPMSFCNPNYISPKKKSYSMIETSSAAKSLQYDTSKSFCNPNYTSPIKSRPRPRSAVDPPWQAEFGLDSCPPSISGQTPPMFDQPCIEKTPMINQPCIEETPYRPRSQRCFNRLPSFDEDPFPPPKMSTSPLPTQLSNEEFKRYFGDTPSSPFPVRHFSKSQPQFNTEMSYFGDSDPLSEPAECETSFIECDPFSPLSQQTTQSSNQTFGNQSCSPLLLQQPQSANLSDIAWEDPNAVSTPAFVDPSQRQVFGRMGQSDSFRASPECACSEASGDLAQRRRRRDSLSEFINQVDRDMEAAQQLDQINLPSPGDVSLRYHSIKRMQNEVDNIKRILSTVKLVKDPVSQPIVLQNARLALMGFKNILRLFKDCIHDLSPVVFTVANVGVDSLTVAISKNDRSLRSMNILAEKLLCALAVIQEKIKVASTHPLT